ncbi:MAG: hypothetical protein GMKNLPBB_02828 [Myxococcota bacterium]|nr:hypothetical protein [Myxococcota bacterium]
MVSGGRDHAMPRLDVSEIRSEQILDAATKLFASVGAERARVEDIARMVELTKGALYLYYKGKSAIIAAVAERFANWHLEVLRKFRAEPGGARNRIERYIQWWADNRPAESQPISLIYEVIVLGQREPEVGAVTRRFVEEVMREMAGLFQEGVDAGEFRAHDVEQSARTIAALSFGFELMQMITGDHGNIRAGADAMRRTLESLGA